MSRTWRQARKHCWAVLRRALLAVARTEPRLRDIPQRDLEEACLEELLEEYRETRYIPTEEVSRHIVARVLEDFLAGRRQLSDTSVIPLQQPAACNLVPNELWLLWYAKVREFLPRKIAPDIADDIATNALLDIVRDYVGSGASPPDRLIRIIVEHKSADAFRQRRKRKGKRSNNIPEVNGAALNGPDGWQTVESREMSPHAQASNAEQRRRAGQAIRKVLRLLRGTRTKRAKDQLILLVKAIIATGELEDNAILIDWLEENHPQPGRQWTPLQIRDLRHRLYNEVLQMAKDGLLAPYGAEALLALLVVGGAVAPHAFGSPVYPVAASLILAVFLSIPTVVGVGCATRPSLPTTGQAVTESRMAVHTSPDNSGNKDDALHVSAQTDNWLEWLSAVLCAPSPPHSVMPSPHCGPAQHNAETDMCCSWELCG